MFLLRWMLFTLDLDLALLPLISCWYHIWSNEIRISSRWRQRCRCRRILRRWKKWIFSILFLRIVSGRWFVCSSVLDICWSSFVNELWIVVVEKKLFANLSIINVWRKRINLLVPLLTKNIRRILLEHLVEDLWFMVYCCRLSGGSTCSFSVEMIKPLQNSSSLISSRKNSIYHPFKQLGEWSSIGSLIQFVSLLFSFLHLHISSLFFLDRSIDLCRCDDLFTCSLRLEWSLGVGSVLGIGLVHLCLVHWSFESSLIHSRRIDGSRLLSDISSLLRIHQSTFECQSVSSRIISLCRITRSDGFSKTWRSTTFSFSFSFIFLFDLSGMILDRNHHYFPILLIICVLLAIILYIGASVVCAIHQRKLNEKKKIKDQTLYNASEEEIQIQNYLNKEWTHFAPFFIVFSNTFIPHNYSKVERTSRCSRVREGNPIHWSPHGNKSLRAERDEHLSN